MYNYEEQKRAIFTDKGQRRFLKIRDHVDDVLDDAGAITMAKAMVPLSGDTWEIMAHVDRLVELGNIYWVYLCGKK